MSNMILTSLLTKTQMQVKMTMILHQLAMEPGLNRARRNVNFHGMGNYKDIDGELDSIKLKIPNFQGKDLEGDVSLDEETICAKPLL